MEPDRLAQQLRRCGKGLGRALLLSLLLASGLWRAAALVADGFVLALGEEIGARRFPASHPLEGTWGGRAVNWLIEQLAVALKRSRPAAAAQRRLAAGADDALLARLASVGG